MLLCNLCALWRRASRQLKVLSGRIAGCCCRSRPLRVCLRGRAVRGRGRGYGGLRERRKVRLLRGEVLAVPFWIDRQKGWVEAATAGRHEPHAAPAAAAARRGLLRISALCAWCEGGIARFMGAAAARDGRRDAGRAFAWLRGHQHTCRQSPWILSAGADGSKMEAAAKGDRKAKWVCTQASSHWAGIVVTSQLLRRQGKVLYLESLRALPRRAARPNPG